METEAGWSDGPEAPTVTPGSGWTDGTEPPPVVNVAPTQPLSVKDEYGAEGTMPPPAIPTLSQGDPAHFNAPPSEQTMERAHIDASKDTPLIPGMTGTSPNGVRAASNAAAMNMMPRFRALVDRRPYDEALKDWHSIYADAKEENPGMEFVGAGLMPLPFMKAGIAAKVAVGAAAGALSGWMGADPEDTEAKKSGAKTGAVMGGLAMGALHVIAPKVLGFMKGAVKAPPRTVVVEPAFIENLGKSLDEATAHHWETDPIETLPMPKEEPYNARLEAPLDAPVSAGKEELRKVGIMAALAKDPKAVPFTKASNLKEMRPLDAVIHNDNGTLKAVVRDVNVKTNTGRIHVTDVTDPSEMYKFKQLMLREHPDVYIGKDMEAEFIISRDDTLHAALHPSNVAAENMAKPAVPAAPLTRRLETLDDRMPTPADEAPGGLTPQGDSLLTYDVESGFVQVHDLKSPSAKIASLRGREIVSFQTPEGKRYGTLMEHPKEGTVLVVPFDEKEGIPTIDGVSRISRDKLKAPGDQELEALVKNPKSVPPTRFNEGHDQANYIRERKEYGRPSPEDTVIGAGEAPPPKPPSQGMEPMPPAPPPGPPPEALKKQLAIMEKVGSMNPAVRQLVHSSQRAAADLADVLSDLASLKNLEREKTYIYNSLTRSLNMGRTANKVGGEQAIKNFRQDMMLAFEGKITQQQLAELYPEQVFVPKRKILTEAVNRRDAIDDALRARGRLPPKSTLTDKQLEAHVNREFLAHTAPDEYAKIAVKDEKKMELAIQGFKNWNLKKGIELDDVQARRLVHEALGAETEEAMKMKVLDPHGTGSYASSARGTMMKKDYALEPWYKYLLGENRDGPHAVARTIAKGEWTLQNDILMEQLASNPKWMVPREQWVEAGQEGWVRMPVDPILYGKASGMMADPFVHDAIVTLPNAPRAADAFASGFFGFIKTNQMGFPSARTLLNMFMSNVEAGVYSGGVDLLRPAASAAAMIRANRAMYKFRKDPLAADWEVGFIRDLRRIGMDSPGHIGLDLNAMQQKSMDQVTEKMLDYKGPKDMMSFWSKAAEAHKLAAKPGSVAIDWFDRNQKIASALMIMSDLMRPRSPWSPTTWAPGKGQGLDYETALRETYKRIAYSNPMPDRLPPLTERLKGSLLGTGSPYLAYPMERNRILAQLPGRLKRSTQAHFQPELGLPNEDPGLPFRLAKHAMFLGTLTGVGGWGAYSALRSWYGDVTEEDVHAAMGNRKGTNAEKYNPFPAVAPVRIGGQVAVMDLTQFLGFLAYFQGDQNLAPLAKILINVPYQVLKDGWAGDIANEAMKVGGIDMGETEIRPPPLGSSGLDKVVAVADWAAKKGGLPRGPMDLYEQVKSTGALGSQGMRREQTPPAAAAMKALGAPIEGTQTVGTEGRSPSAFNEVKVQMKQIADIKAAMYNLATQPPDKAQPMIKALMDALTKSAPSEEKHKLFKELGDMLKKTGQEMAANARAQRAAKASHTTKYQHWVEAPEAETP